MLKTVVEILIEVIGTYLDLWSTPSVWRKRGILLLMYNVNYTIVLYSYCIGA